MLLRAAVAVLLVLMGLAEPASAGPRAERRARAKQCRALCGLEIERCVATEGRRPRACRRRVRRSCRRNGIEVCTQPSASTTTSTVRRPTTTVPVTTTVQETSTTTVTTTSTSTTTLPAVDLRVPWIESGPIQWTVAPPPQVVGGDTFPLELTVDVGEPWVAVEGTIMPCIPRTAGVGCDVLFAAPMGVTAPSFAGPPGTFEFTGLTHVMCWEPPYSATGVLVARVFLIDGEDNRSGPFFSPAARTHAYAAIRPEVGVGTSPREWNLTLGQVPEDQEIWAVRRCGDDFPITASTDLPWLSIVPTSSSIGVSFALSVDGSQVAAPGTYQGAVTISAPGTVTPTTVVPVVVRRADIDIEWTTLPVSVAPTEYFTAELTVGGDLAALTGAVNGTQTPSGFALEFGPTNFYRARFDGPPGTFTLDGRRRLECPDAARDEFLHATVTATDALGSVIGSFTSTSPAIELPAAIWPIIDPEARALTFHALVGRDPLPQVIQVSTSCIPEGNGALTVSTDAEWLTATYVPGWDAASDAVRIAVDTIGLGTAGSPFSGTVTITSPFATAPATIDVTLHMAGLQAEWVTPPPATIEVGDDFTMALSITALSGASSVDSVEGTVQNCSVSYPPNLACLPEAALGLGAFDGPPGLFTFSGHRSISTDFSDTANIVVEFTATASGTVLGPFFAPIVPIAIPEPDDPWFGHSPQAISLLGIAGQTPLSARLDLRLWGGDQIAWTATTDTAWLRVDPDEGQVLNGWRDVRVVADTTSLDPGASPYSATITLQAPGSEQGTVTIPVTLTLVP